jgi:mono/diheme cytochrome c family protein
MVRWRPTVLSLAFLVCCVTGVDAQTPTTGRTRVVGYAEEVKPLLTARCLSCHGPTAQKSGLRVDRRASLLRGGDSGEPSIVPGDGRRSALIRAISGSDPDRTMPAKGKRLSAGEVALLSAWVDQGAEMPESSGGGEAGRGPGLWSLRPLGSLDPPRLDDPWAANPLDAFVLDRLRRAGQQPSPPADRVTLIRRVYLVLLGLPPTPEEIDRFLSDERPEAYERLIDDALGRPEYGERWAQHWLDVIRWAENWGYETNAERPDAWPYRDWVIRSLNDDLPFDRFAFAQLAGDTIGDDAATGLLVAGPANLPGQIGKDEPSMRQARQDELDETVKTVSAAFLGLSVGCARCHDHKFDPVSQRDYYEMQAVFAGLRYGPRRLRGPEDDRWTARARVVKGELDVLRERLEAMRVELGLRNAVEPDRNTERFSPIRARSVRMSIRATSDGSRPSLFEFEVWSAAGEGSPTPDNVALAQKGSRASASSFALENQTRHPDNVIDGLWADGGRFPWTASAPGPAWIQVDLARDVLIDRIVWQRGFEGFPADYEIAVQGPEGDWATVAHSRDRMLHESDRRPPEQVALDGLAPGAVSELVGLVAKARDADAERRRLAAGPQVFAGAFQGAEPTYLLHRGDPMQRREAVAPDIPAVLGSLRLPQDADDAGRRVAFARWVASPDNPLTARVIVNRIWMHHFGDGLVETPSDFGRMGSPPSHPELLDWLAGELIRGGWSLKHVHRLILTSQAFRQAGAPRAAPMAADAGSRLLWRFPPRRLDAEAIRDSILRVSGALNPRRAGPGFDLFNQRGGLTDYIPRESRDSTHWRRMIYATKVRMKPVDIFGAFDCPDAGQMAPRRPRSITPLQALGLMNSEFVNQQAEIFAASVRAQAGPSMGDQVERAFRRALGRSPAGNELKPLEELGTRHGLVQVCRVLFNANEFVFVP